MSMFYRDNRQRRNGTKGSKSWTVMRKQTQVECNHILWDLTNESRVKIKSEMWKVKSDDNSVSDSEKSDLVPDFCGCALRTKRTNGFWLSAELLVDGKDSHVQISPKGRRATSFFCTTEPWPCTKPCQTRMDNSAECATVYFRVLLLKP